MFLPMKHTGLAGVVVLVAVFVAGGFFVSWQFEWHAPVVRVEPERSTLGRRPFVVQVHDRGKGLAFVSIKLVMDGESSPIHFQEFESAVNAAGITVKLDPKQHKLKDGPGFLNVTAADRSYWSFFRGNKTTFERPVTVDFNPPTVEVISEDRYVTQGGTGLVTYKTSPDTERSGVRIGDYFFPGYKGHLADRGVSLAFFSHPYNVSVKERAMVFAEDHAGNTRESALVYNVRPLKYRRSKVPVSDDFIRHKIVPLLSDAGGSGVSPRDQFLQVNHHLRRKKRGDHPQDLPELRGKETVGRPLHAVAQLRGSGQFRRSPLVLLSKPEDRRGEAPRIRPGGDPALPGGRGQQRHRGVFPVPSAFTAIPLSSTTASDCAACTPT